MSAPRARGGQAVSDDGNTDLELLPIAIRGERRESAGTARARGRPGRRATNRGATSWDQLGGNRGLLRGEGHELGLTCR